MHLVQTGQVRHIAGALSQCVGTGDGAKAVRRGAPEVWSNLVLLRARDVFFPFTPFHHGACSVPCSLHLLLDVLLA